MRTIYPDTHALAVFKAVVDLGSFRAAAGQLGLSKSSVSARVAALEEQVKTRLLERTTRSVRMTEAGRTYYRHVTHALDALADGARAMDGLGVEPRGHLRVTAPLDFEVALLAKALSQYRSRAPEVEVSVHLTDRRVDLGEEEFDLALREGPLEDSALVVRRLGTPQRLLTYASRRYLRRRGVPSHPRDLAAHDCLAMGGHREPERWRYYVAGKAEVVVVRPRLTVNSFAVLRVLAEEGQGIVRLPERHARAAGARNQLRSILEEYAPPARALHALYPSARLLAPKVAIFVDILQLLTGEREASRHRGR